MGWITEDNKTYWVPDELPNLTDEWNTQQENKIYLTKKGEIKNHPKWFFGNGALVDDDYLYYNEEWKLIIDNPPEELDGYRVIQCPQEEWTELEKTIQKTYKVYELVSVQKPTETFETEISLDYTYDDVSLTATETWTVRNLNQEELISKEDRYFERLRTERNQMLSSTDYIVSRAFEQGLVLTEDFKNYRQELRDLPQSVNIREVDFETVFPSVPTNLYVV
jgi:hypothetical protein